MGHVGLRGIREPELDDVVAVVKSIVVLEVVELAGTEARIGQHLPGAAVAPLESLA